MDRYTQAQRETGAQIRRMAEHSPYGIKGFYRTYAWKKKRMQIMARDHGACQECRKLGRYARAELVHHIKHLADEPELALEDANLEAVCKQCHEKLHPERVKGGKRFVNAERW